MTSVRIDLYSDTVTKPTKEMREFMCAAEVGDEQRGVAPSTEVPVFFGGGYAFLMMVYSNETKFNACQIGIFMFEFEKFVFFGVFSNVI